MLSDVLPRWAIGHSGRKCPMWTLEVSILSEVSKESNRWPLADGKGVKLYAEC